jgi:hypothetical protein
MAEFLNTVTGQIETYDDRQLTPAAVQTLQARGLRPASPEDVAKREREIAFSSTGQQALAQLERGVRSLTLGQVEGHGSEEDIRTRAEVSSRESPIISAAADFVPDVAVGLLTGGTSALATGAGRVAAGQAVKGGLRAGIGAAVKAAPKAAIAGEALGSGLVAASQEAFGEGRQFLREDPIQDALNTIFWSGIGGAVGGAPSAFRAVKGRLGKGARAAAELADEAELDAAVKAGEREAVPMVPDATPAPTPAVDGKPVSLVGLELGQISKLGDDGLKQDTLDWLRKDERFAKTGKRFHPAISDEQVASGAGLGHGEGIILRSASELPRAARVKIKGDWYLQDGRHAVMVGRERGMTEVFGRVLNSANEVVFEGMIPIAAATKKAAAEAAETAAEKGVTRAERNAARAEADDILGQATRGDVPVREESGFMRQSRLARHSETIFETATKEARNDLNEINRLSQGIRDRAVKHEDVAKNISNNLPAQKALGREAALKASKLAGEIRADAHALGAQLGKKGPTYFSGTARELVSSLMERSKAISKMENGSEIFNALDDMKRIADDFKVALEQGSRTSAKDPLSYQRLIPKVEEFAHSIRAQLEDAGTFGKAGEMQRAYNKTYHEKWYPAKKIFEDSVFRVTGRDYRAFSTLDAWESKVTDLLKTPGTGERRYVFDMLGALREMAEQRAVFGTASKKDTARIIELVDRVERTFGLADETTAAAAKMKSVRDVSAGIGGALGGVAGGIPGAIMGGGLTRGVAEFATGNMRNAFATMRGATDTMIERSVDDWIRTSKARTGGKAAAVKARAPLVTPEDRALMKEASRLGVTVGFADFLGENDNAQAAYEQKRSALFDDEGFADRFASEYGDMARENPTAYVLASAHAGEVRRFLMDRMPANMAVSMAKPRGYPPTNESIEDWSVYFNAATNPRSVFRSLARGDIRPQEVETLRSIPMYKPLYEQMQMTVLTKITENADDLDDQFVMRMSLLFDLDGAGSPAFSNRAATAARKAVPPQPQAQGGKPLATKAATRAQPSNVALTGPTYGTLG